MQVLDYENNNYHHLLERCTKHMTSVGKSFMNISSCTRNIVLAPKFTISMWLNPSKSYCDLFSKQSISQTSDWTW
ncbi:unnamed protein product [Blepharisma stoltei]|uniref:Uncharacterized protein n=1 Tax=Blepharisma stoltei TaxID=1481888 RepID=A0AAU9ISA6_9CILI|nr:unnamed protein product [Blepharisma stoltei]